MLQLSPLNPHPGSLPSSNDGQHPRLAAALNAEAWPDASLLLRRHASGSYAVNKANHTDSLMATENAIGLEPAQVAEERLNVFVLPPMGGLGTVGC
jgi:hypothetical protein